MSEALSGNLEELILCGLCWDDYLAPLVALQIKPELFTTRHFRTIAKAALDHVQRYNEPPKHHLADCLEAELKKGETSAILWKQITRMFEMAPHIQPKYIEDELNNWVDLHSLRIATTTAIEHIQRGDPAKAREALLVSDLHSKYDPGIWMHKPDQVLEFLNHDAKEAEFGLGIEALDSRDIRPARKELFVIMAPKKRGKCCHGDTLLQLPDGTRKPIRDVYRDRDPHVLCANLTTGKFTKARVSDHIDSGVQKCYSVTTVTGRVLMTTGAHQYLTPSGWRTLDDLREDLDAHIAVANCLPEIGCKEIPAEKARLLGYLLADGGLSVKNTTRFNKNDLTIKQDFINCVGFIGDSVRWDEKRNYGEIVGNPLYSLCKTRQWLTEFGISEVLLKDKTIPKQVFNWTNAGIAQFLRAFISCDGHISLVGSGTIEVSLANFEFVMQLKHLLLRFGVIARVRSFTAQFEGKQFPGYGRLMIRGNLNINRFIDKIGFSGTKAVKAAEFQCRKCTVYQSHNCFPYSKGDEIGFEKVVKILPLGEVDTYDLTIEEHSNFLAEDTVVHNSMALVQTSIEAAFTYQKKVLYISLEMSAEQVAKRFVQSLCAMTAHEVNEEEKKIPFFKKDGHGNYLGIEYEKIATQILSRETRDIAAKKLSTLSRGLPRLLIKEFPTSALTMAKLIMYLETLKRVDGFEPDMLVLDYANLMHINFTQLRTETGRIFRELRGIAVQRNIAVVTATQANRSAEDVKVVGATHVSEDWSVMGTADIVVTICRTPDERTRRLARIYVAAARNAPDQFTVQISQSYSTCSFAVDSVYMSKTAEKDLNHMLGEDEDD